VPRRPLFRHKGVVEIAGGVVEIVWSELKPTFTGRNHVRLLRAEGPKFRHHQGPVTLAQAALILALGPGTLKLAQSGSATAQAADSAPS
jgi:hypothetical protein